MSYILSYMRLIRGIKLKISHYGFFGFIRAASAYLYSNRQINLFINTKKGISYLLSASYPVNDLNKITDKFENFTEKERQIFGRDELLIVIPIFNGLEMSRKCIEIALESEPRAEIYAIDDCSTDEMIPLMLEEIKVNFPDRFKWERNSFNIGFVKNANKGMKYANGRHVVLLNSDTLCTLNFASIMCRAFSENEKIASVTPMTNAGEIANTPSIFDEVKQLEDTFATTAAGLISHLTAYQEVKNWPEIPTGVGFALAINGNLLEKIGLFDEVFSPGYGEENDWCMRSKKMGYRHLLCPIAYVHHEHGSSFGASKYSLQQKNLSILNKRYPDYGKEIAMFQATDPLHFFRHWLFLSTIAKSEIFNVRVVIDHFTGGGATSTLMKEIRQQSNTLQIVIHKINQKNIEFKILFGGMKPISYSGNYVDFFKLIEKLSPSKCLLNSTPFVSEGPHEKFTNFVTKLTAMCQSVEMRIHDYHALCPSFHLLNDNGSYCGLPESRICDSCYSKNSLTQNQKNLTLPEWRSGWSQIIDKADQITGYSSESLMRFSSVYPVPQEKLVQTKHLVFDHSIILKRMIPTDVTNLRIATVGNLSYAKGSEEVIHLAKAIKKEEKNHLICHFGEISGMIPGDLPLFGVGRYRDARDLILKLVQFAPDIIFIPSIVPETFNLVSEELKNSEIPILMFRLGAPFERFGSRSNFIFTDYIMGESLLEFIEDYISK